MRGTLRKALAVAVLGLAVAGCKAPYWGTVQVHEHRDWGLESGPIGEGTYSEDAWTTYEVPEGGSQAKVTGRFDSWFRYATPQTVPNGTVGGCRYNTVHSWGSVITTGSLNVHHAPYDGQLVTKVDGPGSSQFPGMFPERYDLQGAEYVGCGIQDQNSWASVTVFELKTGPGMSLTRPFNWEPSGVEGDVWIGERIYRDEYDPDFDEHQRASISYDLHAQAP